MTMTDIDKVEHPDYFLSLGGEVYHWRTGARYGSLTTFAQVTKGEVWVANAGNTAWFKYDRMGGENRLVMTKTGVR